MTIKIKYEQGDHQIFKNNEIRLWTVYNKRVGRIIIHTTTLKYAVYLVQKWNIENR